MKKSTIIILLALIQLITPIAKAQNNTPASSTLNNNSNLVLLGKVWGLLKYHHPAVIKGTYNWDDELIKILPDYNACKNTNERNNILYKWVKNLGEIPAAQPIPDSLLKNAKVKPDYSWIKKSSLSPQLTRLLTQISLYSTKDDQKYIKYLEDDGIVIPTVVNETGYESMGYPNENYRLLAAYRYWNIIEYWYPYKYLAKPKWEDCLSSFITEALSAKDEADYLLFIEKMIGTIHDSHAVINSRRLENLKGLWFMPLTVKFIEGEAVINALNKKLLTDTTIKVGDIITAVNNIPVKKFITDKTPYVSASKNAVVLREIGNLLTRSTDSISNVTIKVANGTTKTYTIKNDRRGQSTIYNTLDFAYQKDSSCFVLPSGVVYVNAGTFKANQVDWVKQSLKTAKGLVIDARQYPRSGAGSLISLLQQLLLADKGAMSKFSSLVKGYPGLFRLAAPFVIGEPNPNYYKGRVAILVNEHTQSTGEFLTMAYQLTPGIKVVGSQTAGADGNVANAFPLPGGISTMITGLGVYYPDGRETQQTGIKADIKAEQTINGFRNHKDDLLDKAVEFMVNNK